MRKKNFNICSKAKVIKFHKLIMHSFSGGIKAITDSNK